MDRWTEASCGLLWLPIAFSVEAVLSQHCNVEGQLLSISFCLWNVFHKYLWKWSIHRRQGDLLHHLDFQHLSPQANRQMVFSDISAADGAVMDMQHGCVAQVQLGNDKSFLFSDSIPRHCPFCYRENSQKLQYFVSCKTQGLECERGR